MIEMQRQYAGKVLRIFIEDDAVFLSARDACHLVHDKNPRRRLERAGILHSRYRKILTRGGVQNMRLITPKECNAIYSHLTQSKYNAGLLEWMRELMVELAVMRMEHYGVY